MTTDRTPTLGTQDERVDQPSLFAGFQQDPGRGRPTWWLPKPQAQPCGWQPPVIPRSTWFDRLPTAGKAGVVIGAAFGVVVLGGGVLASCSATFSGVPGVGAKVTDCLSDGNGTDEFTATVTNGTNDPQNVNLRFNGVAVDDPSDPGLQLMVSLDPNSSTQVSGSVNDGDTAASPEQAIRRLAWAEAITFGSVAAACRILPATEGHSGPITMRLGLSIPDTWGQSGLPESSTSRPRRPDRSNWTCRRPPSSIQWLAVDRATVAQSR
ncbi:hypothetical protein DN069_13675 [Streptacidiphilus pinicola]|uniref:Uncharacterized protein n=1 Tax=Streptacidiphilus pinicola TaxID=2219663 RepID=A0A2X0JBT1_9ACTN|nr:hypothetical protein [Streptacidiphilus pinicola]RAG85008.1 hypothetical protein DN069_13675 [Streptacidiphilus pinicola]